MDFKELLMTALAVAAGTVLAAYVSKKFIKSGDWEESFEED